MTAEKDETKGAYEAGYEAGAKAAKESAYARGYQAGYNGNRKLSEVFQAVCIGESE